MAEDAARRCGHCLNTIRIIGKSSLVSGPQLECVAEGLTGDREGHVQTGVTSRAKRHSPNTRDVPPRSPLSRPAFFGLGQSRIPNPRVAYCPARARSQAASAASPIIARPKRRPCTIDDASPCWGRTLRELRSRSQLRLNRACGPPPSSQPCGVVKGSPS